MCGRSAYLTSFVLVFCLTAGEVHAELRHHWSLDGDLSDRVGSLDFTSAGGGPVFAAGKHGGAVEFDGGGDYVYAELAVFMPSQSTCVWVRTTNTGQSVLGWSGGHPTDGLHDRELYVNADGTLTVRVWTGVATTVTSQTRVNDGAWHHLATGYTDGGDTWLYVDGILQGSTPSSGVYNSYPTSYLTVGIESNVNSYFVGAVDDVRVYDHALTEGEVLGAMVGGVFPFAFGPSPKNGAMLTETWVTLGWSPGDLAVSHDVYLGESFEEVNDGTGDTFRANQGATMFISGFPGYAYPDGLVPGTTYYWRIDEINDAEPNSPWKGNVWSFWIPPKTAYEAYPPDGAKFIDPDVIFGWTGGFGARLHTVYFGDNPDDVADAAGAPPQTDATYAIGELESEKTYYWRVDEFDGTQTVKGDVWSFTTRPDVPVTDPNLVGWWTLDEGDGGNALDWSGHGYNATLVGDPQWSIGYDGGALEFDGLDDYVAVPYAADPTIYTITAWVKPAKTSAANIVVRTSGSGPTTHWSHQLRINDTGVFEHYTYDGSQLFVTGSSAVKANTWYFVAAVAANNGLMRLYVNGREEGFPTTVGTLWADGDRFLVGSNSGHGMGSFEGLADDVRIYDYALTPDEIRQVMRIDPLLAWSPGPANGSAPDLRNAMPLSWSPGDGAARHDVYFGTDKDALGSADESDATGIYRGRQSGTTYNPPEGVEWGGGPYYWRVDEYNTDGTITAGRIWSFTVADFISVDDFESYDDVDPSPGEPGLNRIFDKWIDGFGTLTNGALVGNDLPPYAERTVVHTGAQAMIYRYDNAGRTSEATLTLVYPRDWTEQGVTRLSLWINGSAANSPDRIYVAFNGAPVVYHDDPAATQMEGWTEWVIDLAAFGVDLTNVNSITIGIGTRNAPSPSGGAGTVYFDDIRLYR